MHPSLVRFSELTLDKKRESLLRLAVLPLKTWEQYASMNRNIMYKDSVVGVIHKVNLELPPMAIAAIQGKIDDGYVENEYDEPIVAMYDQDLRFPDYVEFSYYSIYNLFCKYCLQENIEDLLIINQMLSSVRDVAFRDEILKQWP